MTLSSHGHSTGFRDNDDKHMVVMAVASGGAGTRTGAETGKAVGIIRLIARSIAPGYISLWIFFLAGLIVVYLRA